MTSTQVDNTENSVVAAVDTMNSSVVFQAPLIRTILVCLLPLFLFGCVWVTSPDPEGVSNKQFFAISQASDDIIETELVDDGTKNWKTSYLEIAQSVVRAYPNICVETPDAISCLARRTVLITGHSTISSSAAVLDGTAAAGFVVYKNGQRCVFDELQDGDDGRRRFFEDSWMHIFSSDAGLKSEDKRWHRFPIYDAATLLENCNQAY